MAQSKQTSIPEKFYPTVDSFQKLDDEIGVLKDAKDENGKPDKMAMHQAEMLHFNAIEWLRLESLKRYYSDPSDIPSDPFLQTELEHVRKGEHHFLISSTGNPPSGWAIGTVPPFIQRIAAVLDVKPGQTIFGRCRETVGPFSVDLAQTDKAISKSFIEGYIKPLRKKLTAIRTGRSQNKRSKGAGRKYSLAKLWEVLTLYDEYKKYKNDGCSQRSLGENAKTFKPGNPENRHGEKIIPIARHMIVLSPSSSEFPETFGKQ